MARFGQSFIQSLTKPSYQQGLFNLGEAIGSAPARQRELENERSFQKNLFDLQQKGIAATQQGVADPRALQNRINQLTQLAESSRNPAQAAAARKSALALQQQMGQVSNMATQRGANNAVELARAIDAGQFDANPQAKAQLQQRLQTLRQDPVANTALQAYDQNKAKMGIDQVNAQMKALSSSFFANGVRALNQEEAEAMLALEQQKIELAQSAGLPISDYVGSAKNLVKETRDSAWNEYITNNERNEVIQKQISEGIVNKAMAQDDPRAYVNANLSQEYSYLKDDIFQAIDQKEESRAASDEINKNSTLTPERELWLKENKNIFSDNAAILEEINVYESKNAESWKKRAAARRLNDAIDAEQSRQRNQEGTRPFAKEKATNAVTFILGRGSEMTYMEATSQGLKQRSISPGTGIFESPDVVDAVEEVMDSDKRDDFLNRLTNAYMRNKQANPRDAITQVLNDMEIDISGERLTQRRRKEAEEKDMEVQAAINAAFREAGIDPRNATALERNQIERKVAEDILSQINRLDEERMQRVQDVRESARSRRYGENPFK